MREPWSAAACCRFAPASWLAALKEYPVASKLALGKMAYCPQCGVEYREGTAECMDCHVPLRPGWMEGRGERSAEPKLMRIRVFTGPMAVMHADLARNLLETEGIPCVLPGQYSAEMLPGEPIHVLVHERDAARASELLDAYFSASQAEPTG